MINGFIRYKISLILFEPDLALVDVCNANIGHWAACLVLLVNSVATFLYLDLWNRCFFFTCANLSCDYENVFHDSQQGYLNLE